MFLSIQPSTRTPPHVQPNEVKLSTKFLQEFTIDSLSAIELALEIEEFSGLFLIQRIEH